MRTKMCKKMMSFILIMAVLSTLFVFAQGSTTWSAASNYEITGFIKPDLSYTQDVAVSLLSGFKIELSDSTISAISDGTGYFKLSNVPGSTNLSSIKITKTGNLTRLIDLGMIDANIRLGSSASPIEVWVGDMPDNNMQDNSINMADVMIIARVFNSYQGDSKYLDYCDVNKDTAVNMADIMAVVKHFNKLNTDYPVFTDITKTQPTALPTATNTPTHTPTPTNPPSSGKYEVLTWVAAYNVNECMTNLQASYGGTYNPSNTLTTVAVQFYRVEYDGTVSQIVSDSDLQKVKSYCNSNGIKFFLCIFNNDGTWNWDRAASAFATNKTAHINNIVNLVQKVGAEGIDIDYEGNLSGDPYRAEFGTFIKELGGQLHQIGKKLSVDTFAYIWNQPSQNWWGDWKGSVDFINNMGYGDLYGGGTSYHAYSQQLSTIQNAGFQNYQLTLGFPGWLDNWGSGGLGTSIVAHINEDLSTQYTSKPMSICIWDAAYSNGWKNAQVWEALHRVRVAN